LEKVGKFLEDTYLKACESGNCTTSLVSDDRRLSEENQRYLSFIQDLEKVGKFLEDTYLKACESGNCTTSLVSDDRRLSEEENERALHFVAPIMDASWFYRRASDESEQVGQEPSAGEDNNAILAARALSFVEDLEKAGKFLEDTYLKACESGNCTTSLVSDDRRLSEENQRYLSFVQDLGKVGKFLGDTLHNFYRRASDESEQVGQEKAEELASATIIV
jgi:hypothetical protein